MCFRSSEAVSRLFSLAFAIVAVLRCDDAAKQHGAHEVRERAQGYRRDEKEGWDTQGTRALWEIEISN